MANNNTGNVQSLERSLTIIEILSAHPEGLSIKDLSEKYQFQTVTFVDMFPNTEHVESVCILKRR